MKKKNTFYIISSIATLTFIGFYFYSHYYNKDYSLLNDRPLIRADSNDCIKNLNDTIRTLYRFKESQNKKIELVDNNEILKKQRFFKSVLSYDQHIIDKTQSDINKASNDSLCVNKGLAPTLDLLTKKNYEYIDSLTKFLANKDKIISDFNCSNDCDNLLVAISQHYENNFQISDYYTSIFNLLNKINSNSLTTDRNSLHCSRSATSLSKDISLLIKEINTFNQKYSSINSNSTTNYQILTSKITIAGLSQISTLLTPIINNQITPEKEGLCLSTVSDIQSTVKINQSLYQILNQLSNKNTSLANDILKKYDCSSFSDQTEECLKANSYLNSKLAAQIYPQNTQLQNSYSSFLAFLKNKQI